MAIDPHSASLSCFPPLPVLLSPEIAGEWSSLPDEANSLNVHSLKGCLLAAVLGDNSAQWRPLLQSISPAAKTKLSFNLTDR